MTQSGYDYALKLVIPDSIKVLELTPVSGSGAERNFKIRIDQTGGANDSMNSHYSMPVHSHLRNQDPSYRNHQSPTRFLPAGFNRTFAPEPIHVPNENGFKKNPFYQRSSLDQNTAMIENEVYSDVVQATAETPTPTPTPAPTQKDISNVVSEMYGPSDLSLNANADFVIYVANRNSKSARGINVTLDVPTGLDVVLLDRAADVDAEAGSLSWSFDELAPGEEHFIRYRVKSLELGSQRQKVQIGFENGQLLECEFDTNVMTECEESSAPFLPFENE